MAESSRRPTKWQLFLESIQRELTYLPLSASVLLASLAPDWSWTWLLAPALFTAGGMHFIYDLLMGKEVRRQIEARAARKELEARDAEDAKLAAGLAERDREALTAVRALEKTLVDKIRENQSVLEYGGMFAHEYEAMAHQLAESAIATLRRKAATYGTVEQLKKLKAAREARELEAKLPQLDRRVEQVRTSLKEALTQVALMEDEKNKLELTGLSTSLGDRLKLAGEVLRDMSDSGSYRRVAGEAVSGGETPGAGTRAPETVTETDPDRSATVAAAPEEAPGERGEIRIESVTERAVKTPEVLVIDEPAAVPEEPEEPEPADRRSRGRRRSR